MKHCKIHNQQYMDFLHECPTCGGEKLWQETKDGIAAFSKMLCEKYSSNPKIEKSKFKRKLTGFQL